MGRTRHHGSHRSHSHADPSRLKTSLTAPIHAWTRQWVPAGSSSSTVGEGDGGGGGGGGGGGAAGAAGGRRANGSRGAGDPGSVLVMRWVKTEKIVRFEADDEDEEETLTEPQQQQQPPPPQQQRSEAISGAEVGRILANTAENKVSPVVQEDQLADALPTITIGQSESSTDQLIRSAQQGEATTAATNDRHVNDRSAAESAGRDAAMAAMIRPKQTADERNISMDIAEEARGESGRRDAEIDVKNGELGEIDSAQLHSFKSKGLVRQETQSQVDKKQDAFGEGIAKSAAQDAERALDTDARIQSMQRLAGNDADAPGPVDADKLGSFPGDGFGSTVSEPDGETRSNDTVMKTRPEDKLARVSTMRAPGQVGMNIEPGEAGMTAAPPSSAVQEEYDMMQRAAD